MREDVGDQTSAHDHGDLNIVQSGECMNAYHKRCLSSRKSKTLKVTLAGYKRHIRAGAAPGPLSRWNGDYEGQRDRIWF